MSQVIKKLTPEQEALMFAIRDEWTKIALDTSPTNKQKAEEAINLIYEFAGLKPPRQIVWFENPLAALNWIVFNEETLGRFVNYPLWFDFEESINDDINAVIDDAIKESAKSHFIYNDLEDVNNLWNILFFIGNTLDDTLFQDFGDNYDTIWSRIIEDATEDYPNGIYQINSLAFYAYFHAIGVNCSKLEGWWRSANECGIWWSFAEVAVLTPKPSIIRLDARGRLHSECEPAVVYEGLSLYAYHGVLIPEKYGRLHPNEWRAQWLLEEDNVSFRRVLILGIGYERIVQELGAIELDVFQEYTLIKIDTDIDDEPIHLLKMTCPSTGYIHVLRVPPDMILAREAIRWVNWGIDPEEFSVQT